MNNRKYGFMPIVSEEDCTGCSSCMNICNQKAITMRENTIGHLLPYIEESLCVDCGLCRKICPSLKQKGFFNPINKVYAAWAKDNKEHQTSTSGGVSAVFANFIIEKDGIVYGCGCLPGVKIEHIRISSKQDLNKIKGSKYVQSDINYIYKSVKKDLLEGKSVLFTGTPCQCAGLRSYLQRPYDNLFIIDIICHGVPSQKLLKDHIHYLGYNNTDIERVTFREGGYYLTLWRSGKVIYKKDDMHDLYYSGFNDSLFLRESCIHCKYSNVDRVGDITMGDFHKLGKLQPFEYKLQGNVSLITVNSNKGLLLLEEAKERFMLFERTLKEAILGNPQLQKPSVRKSNYNKFIRLYSRYGYERASKQTMIVRLIKNIVLSLMYKF